jgi:hypothetical protein
MRRGNRGKAGTAVDKRKGKGEIGRQINRRGRGDKKRDRETDKQKGKGGQKKGWGDG